VRNLPGGVHAGVGAPSNGEVGLDPRHSRHSVLDNALDGASLGLPSPSGEAGPVVADIQPVAQEPAIPDGDSGFLQCVARTQDQSSSSC
jgi:hypothetical protein